jgi:hypothetical protein
VGLPGSLSGVRDLLSAMYAPGRHVAFHLDVGEEIGPALGLEVFRLDGSWESPLDRLIEWKACLPEKRDPLLAWPGRDRVLLSGHRWSSYLERVLLIKIIHHPVEPLTAKAYLGFRSRFGFLGSGVNRPEERIPSLG